MKGYKKYNIFWKEDSRDLIDFYNLLENLEVYEKLVIHDKNDTHGTAFLVRDDYVEEFEKLVEECNLVID